MPPGWLLLLAWVGGGGRLLLLSFDAAHVAAASRGRVAEEAEFRVGLRQRHLQLPLGRRPGGRGDGQLLPVPLYAVVKGLELCLLPVVEGQVRKDGLTDLTEPVEISDKGSLGGLRQLQNSQPFAAEGRMSFRDKEYNQIIKEPLVCAVRQIVQDRFRPLA